MFKYIKNKTRNDIKLIYEFYVITIRKNIKNIKKVV